MSKYYNPLKEFLKKAPISRQLLDYRQKILVDKRIREVNMQVKRLYESRPIPLFSQIEIETMNRCNGTCEFCPVNRNADTREFKKMDEALLDKIICELKDINYDGEISLYSNNEPFLDNRIVDFIKKVRVELPNAFNIIYTNATVLSLETFKEVIEYLDLMVIDNYNNELKFNDTTKIIKDYCEDYPDIDKKVTINFTRTDAVRSTRGGQAPNNASSKTYQVSCMRPYKQIVIRPDGKISLCCNDALGKCTLGDVNNQTLKEIWYSDKYEDIRNKLQYGRKGLMICEYCDVF